MSKILIEDFTVTSTLHELPCEGCFHQALEAVHLARAKSIFMESVSHWFRNELGVLEVKHEATVAKTALYTASFAAIPNS